MSHNFDKCMEVMKLTRNKLLWFNFKEAWDYYHVLRFYSCISVMDDPFDDPAL